MSVFGRTRCIIPHLQFNAEAPEFDLVVHTTQELQAAMAARQPAHQVTRPVHAVSEGAGPLTEGVGDECLLVQAWAVEVAPCDLWQQS